MPLGDLLMSPQGNTLNELIYYTPIFKVHLDIDLPFLEAFLDLEELTRQWINRTNHQLQIYINWYNTEYKTTYSGFRTVIFRCKECNAAVWGIRLYMHRCTTRMHYEEQRPPIHWNSKLPHHFEQNLLSDGEWREGGGWGVWSLERLEVHQLATAYVKQIMDLCGAKDLETLEEMHPILRCKICHPPDNLFYRWTCALTHKQSEKGAYMHDLEVAGVDVETQQHLEKEEVQAAIQVFGSSRFNHTSSPYVFCKLCKGDYISAWGMVVYHMEREHQVSSEDIRYGVHFSWKITTDFVYFDSTYMSRLLYFRDI
ncbi:hypothetical protein E1B28_002919 [Marasmius oreades]|uniref:Uncharacterized protein n=1 Tax=Marasmius oreades TaxID=181124 RepID=A0A9P7UJT0_9AGAR|nr:uncharacterized protein E1B28_002919 [Marasmius oreades]KAG7085353.1 hypothetical protein E1B28_002919 [Marasmius oreades]